MLWVDGGECALFRGGPDIGIAAAGHANRFYADVGLGIRSVEDGDQQKRVLRIGIVQADEDRQVQVAWSSNGAALLACVEEVWRHGVAFGIVVGACHEAPVNARYERGAVDREVAAQVTVREDAGEFAVCRFDQRIPGMQESLLPKDKAEDILQEILDSRGGKEVAP